MSEGARYLWYLTPAGTIPVPVGVADVPAPEGQTLVKSRDIGNGALAQAGAFTSSTAATVSDAASVGAKLKRLLDSLG